MGLPGRGGTPGTAEISRSSEPGKYWIMEGIWMVGGVALIWYSFRELFGKAPDQRKSVEDIVRAEEERNSRSDTKKK